MFVCCWDDSGTQAGSEVIGVVTEPPRAPKVSSAFDGPAAPAPAPRAGASGTLAVKVGRGRDLLEQGFRGGSDLYVVCQVEDKLPTKAESHIVSGTRNPNWDAELEVAPYSIGEPLLFKVLNKDPENFGVVGTISFPAQAFEDGFHGEVLLEGAAPGLRPCLEVSIEGPAGFPKELAPPGSFEVHLATKPLGVELDATTALIRVTSIKEMGAMATHNAAAEQHEQITVGDYIIAANGLVDKKAIKAAIQDPRPITLTIRPYVELQRVVEPAGRALGLELRYLGRAGAEPEILVTRVKQGFAAIGELQHGDRITSVNGVTALDGMVDLVKNAKDSERLAFKLKRAKPFPSSGPVDVSSLTRLAKDDRGLRPQPEQPSVKTLLVQIYVRGQHFGGSDKSSSGHRYDSIAIANGMIAAGMSCQLVHYLHEEHESFVSVCQQFQAIIVRCNPGQIKADGGDQGRFDDAMRQLRKQGIQVWPSPDVMEQMGAKDALVKVASLSIGLEDTLAYYSEGEFVAGFKKTMAFQPRVIKQNRGSSGEGIWIVKLKEGNYCGSFGERQCGDDEVLVMMEANDNHSEEHSVAEFIEFCTNGRTAKSGTWTSKGDGKYLEGGKAAGGQLVDQRFCPRIVEGELRYNMVVDALVGIIHKKPKDGGISAVSGTGSVYTFYGPEEAKFSALTKSFLERDLPKIMPSLGLEQEPIPLWWTTDFINASPVGTAAAEEKWIVGEFNCSCVGISQCLAAYCKAEAPLASFCDIPPAERAEARRLGNLMGCKAADLLRHH